MTKLNEEKRQILAKHLHKARNFLKNNDLGKASSLLKKLLKHADNWEVRKLYGIYLYMTGNSEEALLHLNKSFKLHEDHETYLYIGIAKMSELKGKDGQEQRIYAIKISNS